MDNLIAAFSKGRLERINREFIKKHGSYFSTGCWEYDCYFSGYIKYLTELLELEHLTYNIINDLLSVVRGQQRLIWRCEVDIDGDNYLGVAMDALDLRVKEYTSFLKRNYSRSFRTVQSISIDLMYAFIMAKKVLLKSPMINGHKHSYIEIFGLKEMECLLLVERQKHVYEKEEERRRLREEAQALKELKREKEQAEKDAAKAKAAIEKNEAALAKAKNEEQTQKLLNQIEELKLALARAEERRERALSMAQQTRCGYVYVISNIGSFGEGVYKIGMTRRVNPIDRVHELGDASVPFRFDVHAMIYTEDAPGLESALHRKFNDRRINLDNFKKEFFRVSLDEIRSEVESMGISTTWVNTPQAEQWRSSERQRNGNTSGSESFAYEYNPFEEFLD